MRPHSVPAPRGDRLVGIGCAVPSAGGGSQARGRCAACPRSRLDGGFAHEPAVAAVRALEAVRRYLRGEVNVLADSAPLLRPVGDQVKVQDQVDNIALGWLDTCRPVPPSPRS